VSDFLEKHRHSAEDVRLLAVQRVLLGDNYDMSLIGKYSKYHLQSVYINGYESEETERLAHMYASFPITSFPGDTLIDRIRWQVLPRSRRAEVRKNGEERCSS
jgi:RNA-dependent RNA polymerase